LVRRLRKGSNLALSGILVLVFGSGWFNNRRKVALKTYTPGRQWQAADTVFRKNKLSSFQRCLNNSLDCSLRYTLL